MRASARLSKTVLASGLGRPQYEIRGNAVFSLASIDFLGSLGGVQVVDDPLKEKQTST
jgi:hypothetical protein